MNKTHYIHNIRLLRVSLAALAGMLLFLTAAGVFFPIVTVFAGDTGTPISASSRESMSPLQSGSVLIPAGDASLPVALTGVSARGAVLM